MLKDFLQANRAELITSCRAKVERRRAPRPSPAELEHGIPLFLDQLTCMLPTAAQASHPGRQEGGPANAQLEATATRHGSELLRHDFTIDQVVHDYGDLCQAITEVAARQGALISVEDFGLLNIKLDNAIAGAVTEFARERESVRAGAGVALSEQLGGLAHEMRNLLNTAILAIAAIRTGSVGFGGATAAALDRSLIGMRNLIDRTLAEVRLDGGPNTASDALELGPFINEVRVAAALEASSRGCQLMVLPVEPGIFVTADRHILAAAVNNLLQNAFKFTHAASEVKLRAYALDGRVLIEVEDECGGLREGATEILFRPFEQRSADRTGVGLGLSISRKSVEASGGAISVRDIPGKGCVFTVSLPQAKKPNPVR